MFQDCLSNLTAGKHAGQFLDALLFARETLDGRNRASATRQLLDIKMVVRKAGDLRQVSYAEHLRVSRQTLQTLANRFGHAAADTGIHLIENESLMLP